MGDKIPEGMVGERPESHKARSIVTPELLAQVPAAPGSPQYPRYRCTNCGNLTRFDVRVTRFSTEYWHFTIDGNREIEDAKTTETVTDVSCRWCGTATNVVEITHQPNLAPVEPSS